MTYRQRLLSFFAIIIIAMASAASVSMASGKDYVIMKVGGEKIRKSEVEELWNGLFPPGTAPDFESFDEKVKQNILRNLASERLLYKEATSVGVQNSQEVKDRIEAKKRDIIVDVFLRKKSEGLVSDEQVKEEYDSLAEELKDAEEIKARHILVEEEDKAKELAEKLQDDADDFEDLAKEHSIDKASAAVGGDLGYFGKDRMVPEFAEAAFALKDDEVSDPVKTAFGWHIIMVEERRPVKVPSFAEVKEKLKADLEMRALDEYIERIIDQTSVIYYGPDGNEKEFSKVPDTTRE